MPLSIRPLLILAMLALPPLAASAPFQPFFDDDPRTRHAPADPELTDFDLDVLTLCGGWGARVEAADFERMMLRPANAPVVARLRRALGDRIYTKAGSRREFVRQLRRVWFQQKGFKHVFCGEPGVGRDLGGLHYAPRYWQAQDRGWAGYRRLNANLAARPLEKCRRPHLKERLRPPLFAIGIEFKDPRGGKRRVKCLSGYNWEMGAEEILLAGTLAFKQANRRVGKERKAACLFETRLAGKTPHYSTLVIVRRALRTFYPRAEKRPYCRKGRRDPRACLCSRL